MRDSRAKTKVSTGTRAGILAVLASAFLLAFSASAQAAAEHPHIPSLSHTGMGIACGTAVDSAGNLYVAEYSGTISIFDEDGALIKTTTAVEPCGLAVDSAGNLYVNSWQGPVNRLVPSQFPPTPTTTYSAGGEIASGDNFAVAVNPANDHVLVAKESKIFEYKSAADGSEVLSESIGEGVPGALYFGVDIDASTGDVYANDGIASKVYVFDKADLDGPPKVTIDGKESKDGSLGFGFFGAGIAVDQANGHVYVFDLAHLDVDEFEASGAWVTEIEHSFSDGEPSDVAVDNSGGANDRSVYVTGAQGVDAFEPLKHPEHPHIPSLSHTMGLACGTAVDSAGNLYVAEYSGTISVFDPSGALLTTASGLTEPCGLAVDSAGNLYVNSWQGPVNRLVPTEFPPTPTTTYSAGGEITSGDNFAVAVNPANDHVLVAKEGKIAEYKSAADGSEVLTESIGEGVPGALYFGVDIDASTGDVYANDGIASKVYVFDKADLDGPPKVTIDGKESKDGSLGFGFFGAGIAVDQANGHVYVFDLAHLDVDEFEASGAWVTEIEHSFSDGEPSDVAVDNSGGANDRSVYVTGAQGVDAFEPLTYGKARFTLKVKKQGTGAGTVESSPEGIECGPTCQAKFEEGTEVTLTADPEPGSEFSGWSGCTSVVDDLCEVTIGTSDLEVTATFTSFRLKVKKTGPGKGTITSSPVGIECGLKCEAKYTSGTEVTLTPSPEPGSKLSKWSGCTSVVGDLCKVTIGADAEVTALFGTKPSIVRQSVGSVTETAATLKATITPNGEATSYQFEYLSEEAYQANGESFSGAPASKVPASPGSIGDGLDPVSVSAEIGGLTLLTSYRFRVVATNPIGTTAGDAQRLMTYGPSFEGLPDGRAYEQVTPVDKNGGDAQGNINLVQAARDGSGITFFSLGSFPEDEGAQDFPVFLSTRSAEGWSTQSLYPPASVSSISLVRGWSEDLSDTYVVSRDPGENSILYRRDNATRSLGEIASAADFGSSPIAGASVDGSVVIFETNESLLPGAIEGKSNVYAWKKESGELRLASVLNGPGEGVSPPEGAFAGSYDWFIENSTQKGGPEETYYTQSHHAVSSDGKALYFTAAGSGSLYLRKNPTEPQSPLDSKGECTDPDLACTIEVSASRKKNGQGIDGTDAAGKRPAAFMAATPDGSKAFFTSSEKLTNDATTGLEPSGPAIARADINGAPGSVDLSFLPANASGVEVDDSHIYWANPGEDSIGRANLEGEEVEQDFITGADNPQGVAVDDEYVYWTNAGSGEDGAGTIGRAKKADGSEVDQGFITGANNPQGIAVNSTHVYWVNAGSTKVMTGIIRADVEDGSNSELFGLGGDGNPFHYEAIDLTLSSAYVYITRSSCVHGLGLATQKNEIAFCEDNAKFNDIATDGTHLYWTNPFANKIGRSELDITDVEASYVSNIGRPQGIAVDATHIYWSANQESAPNSGNDLYRYDAETGELIDVAPDSAAANGAEVRGVLGVSDDGSHVYFAANAVLTSTPNSQGESAAPGDCRVPWSPAGSCNLYHWHEGDIEFISRVRDLGRGTELTGDAVNWFGASTSSGGRQYQKSARVSADGETLLFRSILPLTGYDNRVESGDCVGFGTPLCPELFRYDAGDGQLACVSCNPTGEPPAGPATLRVLRVQSGYEKTATQTRNLSADGNRVFFESPDPLVANDTNGEAACPVLTLGTEALPACQDVYMWEASGTGSCESEAQNGGCLYLLSSGKSSDPSFFADASVSGDDAFFFTTAQLVEQDKDDLRDIYDVRVDGGLFSQNPPPPPVPCEGEGCKPGVSAPPPTQSPSSSSFSGPGNQKPAHKRKQRQSKKRRQAKKQRNGKRHQKRNSSKQRQAGRNR